jgi:sugar (pentulose or hexulose) kinase
VQQHGLAVRRVFAGGGGAKSRLWLQIHADVLGLPIHLPRESEACALGSALVAAVHTGHYADLNKAARHMVQIGAVIEPNQANKPAYDCDYGKYLATYPALRELMHGQV